MSSRRTVGEDNILAMLERDSARRTGTRASNLRLASYGAAAAFAGILVGGVAWLAYDNHKSAEQLQAEHDALNAAPPVVAIAEAPPQPRPPMMTAPAPAPVAPAATEPPRAAVIVDEAAPAARTASTAGSSLPPLVMLPRQESVAAPAAARPAPREAKETAGSAVNPRSVHVAARGADRKVDKKVDKKADKKADKSAAKAQRTAARVAKPTPPRSLAKTAADTPRQRKAAAAAAQVDSDVALISAIISQSERHRGEREAASSCTGAKCPPKQTRP